MTGSVLNITIKLLAILLAVLLWFNVITEKQYEHEMTLPITDIEFPSALGPVSDLPDSLTIKVLAEGKKLLRSDWKRAGLRIRGTRLSRGVNTLELNVETVSLIRGDNVTLLDIPEVAPVTVRMDRIDSMFKAVAPRVAAVPDDGYMVVSGKGDVSPSHIWIIGPRQLLHQIDSVYTEQRVIDDVRDSFSVVVKLQNPNPRSIILRRDSAEVEVIVDKTGRRELNQIPVAVQSRATTNPIVDPPQISITVEGPESLIKSITALNVRAFVNISAPGQSAYARPVLELPDNVTVLGMRPDSVRIIFSP
jgi:hypothetical protein